MNDRFIVLGWEAPCYCSEIIQGLQVPRAIQVLCLVGTPTPVMNLHHDVRELFFFQLLADL